MRQDAEFYQDQKLSLVYIAKKLKEALAVEEILTRAEFDYLVEADRYRGGVVFQTVLTGAFFYVEPKVEDRVREYLAANGCRPWQPEENS